MLKKIIILIILAIFTTGCLSAIPRLKNKVIGKFSKSRIKSTTKIKSKKVAKKSTKRKTKSRFRKKSPKVKPIVIKYNTYGLPPVNTIPYGLPMRSSWHGLTMSPGDKLQININNDDQFSGVYQIGFDGYLQIPFIKPIRATDYTMQQLETILKNTLINQGIVNRKTISVSIRIKQWSDIDVLVKGAVFSPGQKNLNKRGDSSQEYTISHKVGDSTRKRFLSFALKAASGITPYADLKNIVLKRGTKLTKYDLSGVFTGQKVIEIPLIDGDEVIVPSLSTIHTEYIRPSKITPPGIKIIIINLTRPIRQLGLTSTTHSLTYGSRLNQAAQIGGCFSGSILSKNKLIAVFHTDPDTKKITRSPVQTAQHLISNLNSLKYNPYMTQNHSIACYDSSSSNILTTFESLNKIISTLALALSLAI